MAELDHLDEVNTVVKLTPDRLVGLYRPIYMSPALLYFFQNANINLSEGNTVINLMDFFPLLKQGYGIKTIIPVIEYIYSRNHGLAAKSQTLIPDQLMNECFGDIFAGYFQYPDVNGKWKKIPMIEAVNLGLIPEQLTTYQVMQLLYPSGTVNSRGAPMDFNPNQFKTFFLTNINALNIEDVQQPLDNDVLNALIEEYELAKEINQTGIVINNLIKRGATIKANDPYAFIEYSWLNKYNKILIALLRHPNTNQLYISIMFDDINAVTRNLQIYDPRSDNFKAYHLAVEKGNPNIINLIKDNIIQRNLLQQRAFTNILTTQASGTNLPSTIANYAQQYTQGRI